MISQEDVDKVLTHFEKGDYLILQNEISQIPYIMEQAHQKGMSIVLNPSPMNAGIFAMPLEYADYLILNEIEAAAILVSEGKKVKSAEKTDGDSEKRYKQGIVSVKVVDTTAAGDTFTG